MRVLLAVAAAAAAIGATVGATVRRSTDQLDLLRSWQAGFVAGVRQAKRSAATGEATARRLHPSRSRFSDN
jgi:hypothetical protein